MIDRDSGDGFTLTCDECGEECDEYFEDFTDVVNFKRDRSNGWTSRKLDGEWQDLCPSCRHAKGGI